MNTLKISVKSDKDALLLIRLLKSLNFVTKIEPVEEDATTKNQVNNLKLLLDKLADKKLFSKINDPVNWQRQLRNEWS